jgi:hypothetical protein
MRRRRAPALDVKTRKLCAQAVVQVAPEAPPLLLTRTYQPLAGVLQIGGEPNGVHGHLSLSGEILKQAAVGI